MSTRSWCAVAALAAALGVFGVKSVSAQCMYEIVATISTPGCPPFDNAPIYAAAINDHGVVVGHYIGCAFQSLPFVWSEETGFVAIPLPDGVLEAEPHDINNNGEIVGRMLFSDLSAQVAFHWKDGVWTELPSLPGFPQMSANAINDDGMIVGQAFDPNSASPFHAVRWIDGKVEQVQFSNAPQSSAGAVSDQTAIAGWAGTSLNLDSDAFLVSDKNIIEIGRLPETTSSNPVAINNSDEVTGLARVPVKTGSVPHRSWIFENESLTDLGTLPEANQDTITQGINDSGQIVGWCNGVQNGTSKPFLWQNGELIDLRTLITDLPADMFLQQAYAINQHGEIVVNDTENVQLIVLAPKDRPLGDVNFDCVVDERDLLMVLDDWGPNGGKEGDIADIVTNANFHPPGDGRVDGADLAVVLGNWNVSSGQTQSPTNRR